MTAVDERRSFSLSWLLEQQFPAVNCAVEGVLPSGLTMVTGKPKVRKSWLMLDLALSVASGDEWLGHETNPGDVLYLALEDSPRRLQARTKLIDRATPPHSVQFMVRAPRLPELLHLFDLWKAEVEVPRLIIIDTFAMVKGQVETPGYDYTEDVKSLQPLQQWASENDVTIVLVHHSRKMAADHITDTALGSNGIAGTVDSLLNLEKHSANSATLSGVGRDILEFEHRVRFNSETHRFEVSDRNVDHMAWLIGHTVEGAFIPTQSEIDKGIGSEARKAVLAKVKEDPRFEKVGQRWKRKVVTLADVLEFEVVA